MLDVAKALDISYTYFGSQQHSPATQLFKLSAKVTLTLSKVLSNGRFDTSIFTGSDKVCKVLQ